VSGIDAKARADECLYAFVDTNVMMEFQFFRDLDWAALLGGTAIVLVVAPVVLSEIDRFKHYGTKRQKNRARTVSSAFDEIELSHEQARVREGVAILAIATEPGRATFETNNLQPDVPDDRLLAALIEFRAQLTSGGVVLVTDDTNLRVKARARSVRVTKPDDALRLPDEPDEAERKLAAANRELAALKSAQPELRATLDGNAHTAFTVQLVKPLADEQTTALLAAWRARYPHVKATPETIHGPGGLSVSLKMFDGLPGFGYVSKEQADESNKARDQIFANYKQYLEVWHAIVNRRRSTLRMPLRLENAGSAPADDVHVEFWTEASGAWLEQPHRRPKPPALLKARDPLDFEIRPFIPNIDHLPNIRGVRELDGPEMVDGAPPSVRYWARRVKHGAPCDLPEVHFAFDTSEDVDSFTIHYRINAANIREAVEGQIGVKVEAPAPTEAPPPPPPEPLEHDGDYDEDGNDEL
jgi:hypothetical protein